MKLRHTIAIAAALAIGTFGLAPTAGAADTGSTDVTFIITDGGLAITVPTTTVALGTGIVYSGALQASGQLGPITVTDLRGNATATWLTTFGSALPFTTGTGATAAEKIELASITYESGPATDTTGTGTFVPMATAAMSAAPAGRTVGWSAGVGTNSATWDPTLKFALLATQAAGTYAGTITHSVV